MNEELRGRRVDSVDAIKQPGDYYLAPRQSKRALWFWHPAYPADKRDGGLLHITDPPWTFRECDDGSVEVRASILIHELMHGTPEERVVVPEWHGYLDEGHIWRTC